MTIWSTTLKSRPWSSSIIFFGSGKLPLCQVNSPFRVFQPDGVNSVPK